MYTKWTAHLDKDKQHEFKMQVSGAMPVIKRLLSFLEDELTASKEAGLSKSSYDSPAWPYMQADNLGEQRAYNRVIHLLKNLES